MKFELTRLQRQASEEVIKHEILRVASLIQAQFITRKEFDKLSKISSSALLRRFDDSWENILKNCGLENRYCGRSVSQKMIEQIAKKYSDEDLVKEIKGIAQSLNKNELSQEDFNSNSQIAASALIKRFGSWANALKIANLSSVKMAKRYSESEYFENLLNVWTYYGRQPKYREMDLTPSSITSGAYEKKWGKWTNALLAFIESMNKNDLDFQKVEERKINNDSVIKLQKASNEKRDISLGLRYKVLSRDRFKCQKCGNSPATDIKCKLHIDHIIPFSKGGKTVIENLLTVCSDCNLGKGNRFIE